MNEKLIAICKALEDVSYCDISTARIEGCKDQGLAYSVTKKEGFLVLKHGKQEVVSVVSTTYLIVIAKVFLTYIEM